MADFPTFFVKFFQKKSVFDTFFFKNRRISVQMFCVVLKYGQNRQIARNSKIEHEIVNFRNYTEHLYRNTTFFWKKKFKNDDFWFCRCRVLSSFGRFSIFDQKWSCFYTNLICIHSHISKKTQKKVFFFDQKNDVNLHEMFKKWTF
jgi:hypothetical protein